MDRGCCTVMFTAGCCCSQSTAGDEVPADCWSSNPQVSHGLTAVDPMDNRYRSCNAPPISCCSVGTLQDPMENSYRSCKSIAWSSQPAGGGVDEGAGADVLRRPGDAVRAAAAHHGQREQPPTAARLVLVCVCTASQCLNTDGRVLNSWRTRAPPTWSGKRYSTTEQRSSRCAPLPLPLGPDSTLFSVAGSSGIID